MRSRFIISIGLLLVVLAVACQSDEQVEFNRYYSGGSLIYQAHCENCHGEKGEGLQALIPPLTDSVYLKNNQTSLACFLKNGLKGKITINGHPFEGEMPAADLTPLEIAKVLTYVTNSFGNKAGVVNVQLFEAYLGKCR